MGNLSKLILACLLYITACISAVFIGVTHTIILNLIWYDKPAEMHMLILLGWLGAFGVVGGLFHPEQALKSRRSRGIAVAVLISALIALLVSGMVFVNAYGLMTSSTGIADYMFNMTQLGFFFSIMVLSGRALLKRDAPASRATITTVMPHSFKQVCIRYVVLTTLLILPGIYTTYTAIRDQAVSRTTNRGLALVFIIVTIMAIAFYYFYKDRLLEAFERRIPLCMAGIGLLGTLPVGWRLSSLDRYSFDILGIEQGIDVATGNLMVIYLGVMSFGLLILSLGLLYQFSRKEKLKKDAKGKR
jgi:hypothetical protein